MSDQMIRTMEADIEIHGFTSTVATTALIRRYKELSRRMELLQRIDPNLETDLASLEAEEARLAAEED